VWRLSADGSAVGVCVALATVVVIGVATLSLVWRRCRWCGDVVVGVYVLRTFEMCCCVFYILHKRKKKKNIYAAAVAKEYYIVAKEYYIVAKDIVTKKNCIE
jgi:hypothetical protein